MIDCLHQIGIYKIIKIIHESFDSIIYKGFNIINKKKVIIKEYLNANKIKNIKELKFYLKLKDTKITPKMWYYEKLNEKIIVVFSYEGNSLYDLFKKNNKSMNIHNLNNIAINVIMILKNLHEQNIIHGNLNLKKILIKNNNKELKYSIIGFKYSILERRKNKNSIYNNINIFSSLSSHLGVELAKKNDFESLGYMLIYLINFGKLFNVKSTNSKNKKVKLIEIEKKKFLVENLKNKIPDSWIFYFNYIKNLNIENEIDDNYLIKLFKNKNSNILFLSKSKINENSKYNSKIVSNKSNYLASDILKDKTTDIDYSNENLLINYSNIFNKNKVNKIKNKFLEEKIDSKIIFIKQIESNTNLI